MAKNVFGVRNDADHIDGQAFILREVPQEVKEKIDAFGQEAESFADESAPSRRLSLLRSLSLMVGVILFMVARFQARDAGTGTSFGAVFRAYPVHHIVAFALAAFAIGTVVYERIRAKRLRSSDVADRLRERSDAIDAEAYDALGVPPDAIRLDLLTSSYRVKNGEEKNTIHTAFDFRAFIEDGKLCLADVGNVVGIPLESIVGYTRVERRIAFYFWNKTESPRSETYRPYHIRTNYMGAHTVKGVYIMHIRSDFGEYEILVPPYEIETLARLTGKSVT